MYTEASRDVGDDDLELELELELEDHVSPNMVCPISRRIMDRPVTTPSGHSYDHFCIVAWLKRRPVDPLNFAPLAVTSLYPNRVLQDEIADQLERLTLGGDKRLAEAARVKLASVRAARASIPPACAPLADMAVLDRLACRCARWVSWYGLIAFEQVLVFTTSFGAMLCLALDASDSIKSRSMARAVPDGVRNVSRPPLLTTFLKLAALPTVVPPRHWHWLGRANVIALRCVLLVPIGSMSLAVMLGSFSSLLRFAQRCAEVREVEQERAAQSRQFTTVLTACSSVAGFCSLGLFLQLYWDYKNRRLQN
mmetsp:Transcript_5311/g.15128  ORF Transcript_5311/g.15128 Transcript_5311/m.15128 type:complete len:309 (-) Transcript_5311:77-1003(-)